MRYISALCAAWALLVPLWIGCAKETKSTRTGTTSTPNGTTKTSDTHTVESSGQNPPASSSGEKGPR